MRAFGAVAGIGQAQQSPEIFDVVDTEAAAKFLFRSYGAPLNLLRKEKDVKDMREKRADLQQKAQQAQLDQMNSESGKNVAQAKQIQQGQ